MQSEESGDEYNWNLLESSVCVWQKRALLTSLWIL